MFKALLIGKQRTRMAAALGYHWVKAGKYLTLNVARAEAVRAGLAPGDAVQIQFGEGEHKGKFALAKGTENVRTLRGVYSGKVGEGNWSRVQLVLPEMPPLKKAFAKASGALELVDADKKGVLVFTLAE